MKASIYSSEKFAIKTCTVFLQTPLGMKGILSLTASLYCTDICLPLSAVLGHADFHPDSCCQEEVTLSLQEVTLSLGLLVPIKYFNHEYALLVKILVCITIIQFLMR